ncbi:MAG: SufD family Fe-S cluster assembly protein, partial [Caldivirga sp.]
IPSELRIKARELASKIPYQLIKDSPTVKYYTQWNLFDKCIETEGSTSSKLPKPSGYDVIVHNGELVKGAELLGDQVNIGIDPSESRIIARHLANLREVYPIVIKEGEVKVMLSYGGGQYELNSNHVVINVVDHTMVNLAISIVGNGGCGTNVVEINVGNGATLNLLTYSTNINPSFSLIRVTEGDRASVNAYTIVVNGEMTHHREDYILQGQGASINSNSLEFGSGNSRVDYMINIMHVGEHTMSNSTTRAIALDSATVVHRGFGRITERGRWSSTSIEGKVFIGSSNAVGMSVPIIMVDTGDVNGARHSATDASIDEDQELYLRMRGLSREEAIGLVVYDMVTGFLDSISASFKGSVSQIRESLMSLIRGR